MRKSVLTGRPKMAICCVSEKKDTSGPAIAVHEEFA
jgi:hypothetical protein